MRFKISKCRPVVLLLGATLFALSVAIQLGPSHHASAQTAGTATVTATVGAGSTVTPAPTVAPTSTATSVPVPVLVATAPTGICGAITSFTPATSTSTGSISFSNVNTNQTFTIAQGTVLSGSSAANAGGNVCLAFTLNAAGTIVSGGFQAAMTTQLIVCGVVAAYTPATLSTFGSLSIGGITFPLGLGTSFVTPPTPLTTQTFTLTLNGLGIVNAGTLNSGTCTGTSVQGPFTTFTPPTATSAGSITIGGATFPIAAGTTITATHSVPLAAFLPSSHGSWHKLGWSED